jgi:hypothetical protein
MSTAVYPIIAQGLMDTIARAMAAEHIEEWPPEAVDGAVANCQQARRALRGIRQNLEQMLCAGVTAQAFLAQNELPMQLAGRAAAELDRLRNELSHRPLAPKLKEFLSESEALVREYTDLHDFLAGVFAKAKAPPRPIDWNRVQEAERAFACGETRPFQRHPTAGAEE